MQKLAIMTSFTVSFSIIIMIFFTIYGINEQKIMGFTDNNFTQSINENKRDIQIAGNVSVKEISKNYEINNDLRSNDSFFIIDKEAGLAEFEEQLGEIKENLYGKDRPILDESNNISNQNEELLGNKTNLTVSNIISEVRPANQLSNANITLPFPEEASIIYWDGLNMIQSSRGDEPIPPDVSLAVGPDHIVQMVHSAMKIWNKDGTEVTTVYLDDFFSQDENHILSDPTIIYDNDTEHWFSAVMDNSLTTLPNGTKIRCLYNCYIDVAVSTTSDPTGSWTINKINFTNLYPDYPMIGISEDKFALGVNLYRNLIGYNGTQFIIIDKDSLIENRVTDTGTFYSDISKNYSTIVPVKTSSNPCLNMESTNPFLRVYVKNITLLKVCGNPIDNNLTVDNQDILVDIKVGPSGVQPGEVPNDKVATSEHRIRSSVQINDTIFSGHNTVCISNSIPVSCIKIVKLNTTDYSMKHANFLLSDVHIYYPAINVNRDGNLVIGFSMSNATMYPSGAVVILDQEMSNPRTFLIVQGNANSNTAYPEKRFGDYFSAVPDPIDGSIWISGEYGNNNTGYHDPTYPYLYGWSTYIANIDEQVNSGNKTLGSMVK